MIELYASYALVALLAVGIFWREWPVVDAVSYISVLLAAFLVLYVATSNPRPLSWEFGEDRGRLLAAHSVEDVGIYLLVQWEHDPIPRYYSLPWDLEDAKKIRREMRISGERGVSPRIRFDGGEKNISQPPVKPNPPK